MALGAAGFPAVVVDPDKDIDEAVRRSPARRARDNLLASVPGVGSVTAGTLPAARFNTALKPSYQRLLADGKSKKLALIAVARKPPTILTANPQRSKTRQNA